MFLEATDNSIREKRMDMKASAPEAENRLRERIVMLWHSRVPSSVIARRLGVPRAIVNLVIRDETGAKR